MPRPSPHRAATFALALLLLLASAPSVRAWVCAPDPLRVCEFVQDTTGVIVDIATSPEGIGVIVVYTVNGQEGEVALTLCVHNLTVWISQTGYCTTPPTSPHDRVSYLVP